MGGAEMDTESNIFGGESGVKRRDALQLRVIEHNILVLSKYYTRIQLSRMADVLDLPAEDAEKRLSEMVVMKKLYARIDRMDGIVRFTSQKQQSAEMLDQWSNNIEKLLGLVEKSCHLIHK